MAQEAEAKESQVTAEMVIEKLQLEPLVGEGGYYKETYRSEDKVTINGKQRCVCQDEPMSIPRMTTFYISDLKTGLHQPVFIILSRRYSLCSISKLIVKVMHFMCFTGKLLIAASSKL